MKISIILTFKKENNIFSRWVGVGVGEPFSTKAESFFFGFARVAAIFSKVCCEKSRFQAIGPLKLYPIDVHPGSDQTERPWFVPVKYGHPKMEVRKII